MWRFIKWIVKFLIFMFVVLIVGWYGLKYYFTHVNKIADQVRNDVSTQVQTHQGHLLTYNDIPVTYRDAVVATEDRTFFTNAGIDFKGIGRAIWVDIGSGQTIQGGSSITQQLVHNTLLSGVPKSLIWKFQESIYAIGLYDTMSKEETFTLYANDIYFGQGAYGLDQASEKYFGKKPSKLNKGELTMLAGIPNAPNDYNPLSNMTLARQRQQKVVKSMVDAGMISQTQANQIIAEPILLNRSN